MCVLKALQKVLQGQKCDKSDLVNSVLGYIISGELELVVFAHQ